MVFRNDLKDESTQVFEVKVPRIYLLQAEILDALGEIRPGIKHDNMRWCIKLRWNFSELFDVLQSTSWLFKAY